MEWSAIIDYMDRLDPAMRAALRGADIVDIRKLELDLDVRLPGSYVDFLLVMGRSSPGLAPFGASRIHDFHELIAELAEEVADGEELSKRFFRVSILEDETLISAHDNYLDLSRRDGEDAALVMFEQGGELEPGDMFDKGVSLLDEVLRHLFLQVDLDRRQERVRLLVHETVQGGLNATLARAVEIAERSGLGAAWPPVAGLACLSEQNLAVCIQRNVRFRMLLIDIGSNDVRALRAVADRLLHDLPGVVRDKVPPRPKRR